MAYINYTPQLFEGLLQAYEKMLTSEMVVDVDDTMMSLGEDYSNNLLWNDKDELASGQEEQAHQLLEQIIACFQHRLSMSHPARG